jgi:Flp pilus assembly protein TadG
MVTAMQKMLLGARGLSARLVRDCRGIAAVEFAVIVPLMLTMFFGTLEFSSGVAVDRKISLVARTLSDLTSQQSTPVTDLDLANFTTAGKAILTPYSTTPLFSTITSLYVDATTKVARVQWSKGSSPRSPGSTVTIPQEIQVAGTYLIMAEVNYRYVPTIGYVMAPTGVPLSDVSYTRPRQGQCVVYIAPPCTKT